MKNNDKIIRDTIAENISVKQKLLSDFTPLIAQLAEKMAGAVKNNHKLIFCGNGGSAADAQHLAAELVVRLKSENNRPAIPAMALTVDTSILTAAGNDFGFNSIFSRQIEALGNAGDILIAISTSGNSANIIQAVETAQKKGLTVIGFLGGNGGKLKGIVDVPFVAPSEITARIQETHILVGHILCDLVERELFDRP